MPGEGALLVIAATRPWTCANCGTAAEAGEFLHMDDAGPLCLTAPTSAILSSCRVATPR